MLGLALSVPVFGTDISPASLNFFFDPLLNPMIGLSCSSELECKNKCSNSESCQKSVPTCLSCIGSKSPYLNDFFNNISDLTTSCFDQGFLTSQAESLFRNVSMVPIFPISPYNPLGLKDLGLMLKFMTLCPAGVAEPIAIAFTDATSHAIKEISLIKCGQSLFPLVKFGEDCAEKADHILNYINHKQEKQNLLQASYDNAIIMGEALSLKYDVLQFSEYAEAQYIGCTEASVPLCLNICHSSLSCAIPLSNEATATGIAAFNKGQFSSCGLERFSPETLVNYLNPKDSFSFNSLSLSQIYDLPTSNSDFKDFSIITSILQKFAGVFKSTNNSADGSFFISDAYQIRLEAKMKSFCDPSSSPFILGHKDQIERVFCRSGQNGYFKILANAGESCSEKRGKLSISNIGSFK
jgi:hypothetical protein